MRTLTALLAIFIFTSIPSVNRQTDPRIETKFHTVIGELNQTGRISWPGLTGGLLTNLKATITDEPQLGCYGQAEYLRERLNVPGWSFQIVYGRGTDSPILLPHQWLHGDGPSGAQINLDPWLGEIR